MRNHSAAYLILFTLLCLTALTGCVKPTLSADPEATQPPYRPPTLLPSAAPPTATANAPTAASPANCTDVLAFRSDLTIPDGTVVAPGSTMDKRWEIENTGTCNWNESYTLRLIAGPALGSAEQQPLFPARAGSRAEIRILFTAPDETGPYRSAWQAHNPAGAPFGDPIYIDILVQP